MSPRKAINALVRRASGCRRCQQRREQLAELWRKVVPQKDGRDVKA